MRLGALVPTLALGAALLAPPPAVADHHRSSERGRPGYHRSGRGHGERYTHRSHHRRYDRSHHRSYRHGKGHHYRSHRHPYYRPYYRTHRRPYYYPPRYYYRPAPPVYYAPRPVPYGYYGAPVWPVPRRGGVHGHVSLGLPFFGVSLYF